MMQTTTAGFAFQMAEVSGGIAAILIAAILTTPCLLVAQRIFDKEDSRARAPPARPASASSLGARILHPPSCSSSSSMLTADKLAREPSAHKRKQMLAQELGPRVKEIQPERAGDVIERLLQKDTLELLELL